MDKTKPYEISKNIVLEAFKKVKENKGAAGIDGETIDAFESDLLNNLHKIWNRMSSGSYFPPPVKAIEIPKKSGGTRILGIPTVLDRVAQMVTKLYLEPQLEPFFHPDSYGYRPGKSASDALAATRKRCWRYNWLLEFDIKGLFDNINHDLLVEQVSIHTDKPWIILYIQRWLKAPFQMADGTDKDRTKGTPQGGVVSPLLANLFLHYAFDQWMFNHHRNNPFARYADDSVIHCRSKKDADRLRDKLEKRLSEFGLELHPTKTRIVYCKDDDRQEDSPETKFDFLGYTFRPRRSKNKYGKHFINFTPAVSNTAKKSMQQEIHDWRMHLKSDLALEDLSHMFNPILRGWVNYYGLFYKSELYCVLKHMNRALTRWALRKYKKLAGHKRRARHWLGKIARRDSKLFVHWQIGIFPEAG
jgi:RNA-directed DNA polymerase